MAGFSALADHLADLQQVPSRVATEAAAEISDLIQEEFASGRDPYGRPWAPLLQSTLDKGRSPPPLFDTGEMAGASGARPAAGAGIELNVPMPGLFHQFGTRYMVPRPVLPDGAELPISWQQAIESAAEHAVRRALRR